MASEAAKELARKQKAEAKALKEAKKHSDNPSDWGTIRQIRETYKLTAEHQPRIGWMLAGAVLGPVVVGVVVGLLVGTMLIFWILLGLLAGLTVALFVLQRQAKKAAFARAADQAGGAQVALSLLDKKKWHYTMAIALDKQENCVHRAIGPGGLILIGEGKGKAATTMLRNEARRHRQVLYGVDVQTVMIGNGTDQVPLPKLYDYIKKLPKKLSAEQIEEIEYRLVALDSMRPRVPLPKGPLPTSGNMRVSRRAMRG
ncbi:DUF4191 domain-containing protein [Propionibacterium freudenreichii]|jgi:F0F1-type ATP synthase assembly protein I|uniref:Integral membrane protein n=2 Tax=Propionibacterium freudenreichii TaxID=1744 RepID=A0A2C8B4Q6_9ACTN|nr:DUF4191 domain-containing protein [Propionibacterium freudenreichii]ARO12324.1 hypothetical protein BMR99_07315 [Propionibacterium freudenreichii]AWY95390.1 Integral membrane protein [Propionibacterium freudenreichii]MCT2990543.1 DUF4191 family protein [Propionibacterium freudenreichii]MCT2993451.1 DUF4191 family protein [Propionibacterium freudenreichii]MCT2999692.1 DUF4191 family protein [Propionibacterium freudenreichii]